MTKRMFGFIALMMLMMATSLSAHAGVVTVKQSANGTVAVDKPNAAAGETVTITVTPNEGFYTTKDLIKAEKTIGKELAIRKSLSRSCLYSSAFTVATSNKSDTLLGQLSALIPHPSSVSHQPSPWPARFILNGKGWGHGVGLCQIGAAVMGAKGIPYDDILKFYYQGTEIEKAW